MVKNVLLFIGLIGMFSCNKCKECYLIEEVNGNKSEYSIGELCGDEIEQKENEELNCSEGNCSYVCR